MANYSRTIPTMANSPEDAMHATCGAFSQDFLAKATVYVFDAPPALIVYKGRAFQKDGEGKHVGAFLNAAKGSGMYAAG